MFKKSLLLFFIICFHTRAYSASAPVRIDIKIRTTKTDDPKLIVLVKDKSSDQKIVLEVPHAKEKLTYAGTYILELDQASKPTDLEFSVQGQNRTFFIVPEAATDGTAFTLFSNEAEAKKYSLTAKAPNATLAATKPTPSVEKKPEVKIQEARISNQKQEEQRLNLELEEAKAREAARKRQEELSKAEKKSRAEKALKLINEANQFYSQGQFKESTYAYSKAIELDPSMDEAYYRYGVSLYKIKEYNKSLAVLSMGEGGSQNKSEYDYYVALNHMKLKEYDKALDGFHSVRDEDDKSLSASAAFLAGNIEFQTQKYSDAKADYEYVIDHSADPQMDNEAEKKLEEIDRIEQFLANAKEIFHYSLMAGFSNDSNILNVSQSNVATNNDGYRISYGGNLQYKAYQNYQSELAAQFAYSDIYTLDSAFKATPSLQAADPLSMTFSLPYKTRIDAAKKSYFLSFTPSFSTLTMDTSGTGSGRKQILQSTILDSDITYQVDAKLISAYRIQLAQDVSFASTRGSDDDQSSTRTTIGTTQTYLLDPKGLRSWAGDLSYAMNDAKGVNSSYNKAILGVIYGFPGAYSTSANFKLEYIDLNYFDNTSNRKDTSLSGTLSAGKALGKNLSLAGTIQYLKNDSNVEINKYDKTVIGVLLIYGGSVSKK